MQIDQGIFPRVARHWPRGLAAVVAVALVHIGLLWMLMLVHQSAWRPHRPRPFQVVIVPPAHLRAHERKPRAPDRTRRERRAREPSTAITYPPVPESVFDNALARDALRNLPDCAPEHLAQQTPEQRERCARMVGVIAPGQGRETDRLDPTLLARFAHERRQNGHIDSGPARTCRVGSRQDQWGLACWGAVDH